MSRGDITHDVETLARDVVFQPARLIVAVGLAACIAALAWLLPMPRWMVGALVFILAVRLLQPLMGGNQRVSRVRLAPGMVIIEDRMTQSGQARAVLMTEIERVSVFSVYLNLRLTGGRQDGCVVKAPQIDELGRAIKAQMALEAA